MKHDIQATKRFFKGREKCSKRGWDLNELDAVIEILRTRKFTDEEIILYKPHYIARQKINELHIGGRSSNWVMTYFIKGNTLYLEHTGTHDEVLGSILLDSELAWI